MDKITGELSEFMKRMQMTIEVLTKEIMNGNEALGREIRDCKVEVKEEIKMIKDDIKQVRTETRTFKDDMKKADNENKERMRRMEGRLEKIERESRNIEIQKRKHEELENKDQAREIESDIQPAGSKYSDRVKKYLQVSEINTDKEPEYKSTWAQQMSQASLETQLKLVTEAAQRLEAEKEGGESEFKRRERERKKNGYKMKLGDSNELHEEIDWPWEESEGDWDGTVNRAAKNQAKKDKDDEKKRKKLDKAIRV